jgi:hypothetical protein
MDVILTEPIIVSINSAKLVIEDNGRGTIEFIVLEQPVRLNIESTSYVYDTTININDRVRLIEAFSAISIGSEGIVTEIIPDSTEDRAKVLFDLIYPDQTLKQVETLVTETIPKVLIELPLDIIEKI